MKTVFSYSLWRWTEASESLFDLSCLELAIYKDFVALAEADS